MRAADQGIVLTPEEELLLACCRSRGAVALEHVRRLAGGVHWDRAIALADAHGVSPLFASRLVLPAAAAPDMVRQALQQRLVGITALNLGLTRQLAAVLALLDADGIPALAFKGPTLAAVGYGHVGLRTYSDLDILVAPQTIEAARRSLMAHGFVLTKSDINSVFPRAGCEEVFVPEGRPGWTAIEMQSRVWKWPMALTLETADLIARRQTTIVGEYSLPTLDREDLILTLALHGLYHGWTPLRLICDVDAAIGLCPDWAIVIGRARAARAGRILSLALLLAHETLGADCAEGLDWARRDRVAVSLARQIRQRLFRPPPRLLAHPWKDWIRLRSRERLSDKARYCVRTVASERVIAPLDAIQQAYTAHARSGARVPNRASG